MPAKALDGTAPAAAIRARVKAESDAFLRAFGRPPSLHICCAQRDFASNVYVRRKQRAGAACGIRVTVENGDLDRPDLWVARRLDALREAPDRPDGVILQLPVDSVPDPRSLLARIPPAADVDCLTPENLGLLAQGAPRYPSCTPTGVVRLLDHHGIPLEGSRVLVVNDSLIVGRPLAMILATRGATITIAHKRSRPEDVFSAARESDVVVVAVGAPGFLRPEMVRPGAAVVDVGINRTPSGVVGDCHPGVAAVAGWVSPVPGGVGPLTVSVLLENVVRAAWQRASCSQPGSVSL